ncbi:MAG: DUF3857 domain-containing protein [Ginsengibacter sp.]
MKKYISILLITFFPGLNLFCQTDFSNYAASILPENLKKDANAVYRLDERTLDIQSSAKYTFTTHEVITLLNKDAAYHLHQRLHYDKFNKIENVVFKIYDAGGDLIKTYQKKDFNSKNYIDESLYTDNKLLYVDAASPGYPCTIEMMSESKTTGYIKLPDWIIVRPNESVENSTFIINVAPSLDIKYRALNTDIKPLIETAAGTKTYTWTAKNISASKPEHHSYSSYNLPKIEVVADAFEYDGYKGELKSWQSFGAWNYQFYEDNKPFTKEDIQKIQALVVNCKTDREKIKILYNYLEQNMRYVSIQLGIGGFKPFPVKYVNDKRYGDCKALTNYMRYLLKTVGINSYPALINSDYNDVPADINFPSDPFDHVILCVPLANDSIWLECTSNNKEYGFLGSFTENKNALLLTEKGGVLVATPKSRYTNNIFSTKTIITLNEDGGSKVISDIYCTGDFWDLFYQIMKQDEKQKQNIFINYLHYKIPEVFKINTKPDSANGKQFSLTLSYDQQYDFKTGNKLFFKPRISMLSSEDIQPVITPRRFDYIFDFPYNKIDTTVYILTPGSAVEKLPVKKELSNEYASYSNEYFKNERGDIITVVANLSLKKRLVPPTDYLKVARFFQEVKRVENEKFIVKKN